MKYLHTMVRVFDLDKAIEFFNLLGLKEVGRFDVPEGKFTLVFMSAEEGDPPVELTYNWDQKEPYSVGRSFGHLAYEVDNVYEICRKLQDAGVDILQPPRDGKMAFVRSPDQISIEFLQKGEALPPQEPWISMKNQGTW